MLIRRYRARQAGRTSQRRGHPVAGDTLGRTEPAQRLGRGLAPGLALGLAPGLDLGLGLGLDLDLDLDLDQGPVQARR